MESLTYIGNFVIENGIIISDPCYKFKEKYDIQAHFNDNDVMKGNWKTFSDKDEYAELICIHESISKSEENWNFIDKQVAVDSGQMGVFDTKHFKDDNIVGNTKLWNMIPIIKPGDKWYSMCCAKSTDMENNNFSGVIPFGAVSKAGYGDGLYSFATIKKDGKICGIRIVFIEK